MIKKRDPFLQNMAIQNGGLLGRPRGSVGGITYGAARTRLGKVVTAREKVFPSNPQTAGQVLQRNIFLEGLFAVRHLGATLWQGFFNRSIGQLPGFQSMMSILLSNTDSSEEFNTPPDTPLGNLTFPGAFAVVTGAGASDTVDVTWSSELGLNGTDADEFQFFVVKKVADPNQQRYALNSSVTAARSAGSATVITAHAAIDVQIGCFIKGLGTAVGILSLCRWSEATTKA